MLVVILWVVYSTWNWNLIQIVVLFIANFIANLFVMIAISNYSRQMNKVWSIYHLLWTTGFTCIWIYWAVFNWEYQYIIFQITFLLAAIKAISFYRFQKNFKQINELTVWIINIAILVTFVYYFSPSLAWIIQWFWFAIVTTWLVSTKDTFRYFMNLIWSVFIIAGSSIVVISSFVDWELNWIALGFLLLTLTSVIYFLQLLPWYLKKKKDRM